MRTLRVGNASGFYGDRFSAFQEMLTGGPLDVLTGDYLAEITMGTLGRDRLRDPSTGYAKTFLRQMESCLDIALDRNVAIVVNAGGVNPRGLADALIRLNRDRLRIGYVTGDQLDRPDTIAANAYLGAFGIAECLRGGANVVVTGRVTDASLVIGPAIAHFGWTRDDLDALAGAMVAGHIIECGPQATGGNYAFFGEIPDMRRPGFPIAELSADGSATIAKHPGTGGAVTVGTVTAQLLYEIGSPAYVGPDVVAHLDSVRLSQDGPDRVRVTGTIGSPPPSTLKVGVTRLGGYRNAMTFVLCGLDIDAKAALIRRQLDQPGLEFDLVRTDRPDATSEETASAVLHVRIRDDDPQRAGRTFSQAAVELALSSYPGATLTTPPSGASPDPVFTAERIAQRDVTHIAVRPDGTEVIVAPPTKTEDVPQARPQPAPTIVSTADTVRRPLGEAIGARSGDKGTDANVGVWARSEEAYAWLRGMLTVDELRRLLPETATKQVERYELPNLRAINFVVRDLLHPGRFDPQAKALGELLRARIVDVPTSLLPADRP
jgi:hypothetical protein